MRELLELTGVALGCLGFVWSGARVAVAVEDRWPSTGFVRLGHNPHQWPNHVFWAFFAWFYVYVGFWALVFNVIRVWWPRVFFLLCGPRCA